ncbi:hypothetical protein CSAL01_06424 [Colletotrichum salicis]|uniref:Dynamin N-terminal domain-containing protein n=1 Tax=Colletotrichum salicis TaxID=1209931 RepID=A0A135UHA9_9PEZI|nr:hypothetical protein CSAL01_06424 [Colletotrichum salicis]
MPPIKIEGVKAERPDHNLHEMPMSPDTALQHSVRSSNSSTSIAAPTSATAQPNAPVHYIKHEPASITAVKQEQAEPIVNPSIPANDAPASIEETDLPAPQEEVLESLKVPLSLTVSLPGTQVMTWVKAIEDLKARSRPPKTIVGVVGNTGAGKSSVINALLDEERLLPTNCLRACTASRTEISYNDSEELYRSEIEFISVDDWKKELKTIHRSPRRQR